MAVSGSHSNRKGCDVLRSNRRSGIVAAGFITAIIFLLSSIAAAGQLSHKIKQGDTLWVLAKKYKTTPKAIAKANGISENAILGLGKKLRIPAKYAPAKKLFSSAKCAAKHYSSSAYYVHTRVNAACLRSGPSTSNKKIAALPAGATVKLLARKGKWAKVALGNGTCGFVYRNLLAHGSGSVASTKATTTASGETDLVQMALACRGDRYRRGGTSRGGFDCSGFTRYVFARYGIRLPHSSAAQSSVGNSVDRSALQPGDLVFFHTYRRGVSHVGIYVGDNRFVHAATYGRGVRVDSMNSSYYASRYVCARRVK